MEETLHKELQQDWPWAVLGAHLLPAGADLPTYFWREEQRGCRMQSSPGGGTVWQQDGGLGLHLLRREGSGEVAPRQQHS